jgi:glycosyltransferase involved in cell wall biosynthesis
MRKKILILGMLDSIHLGRWLEQFEDQKIDFVLFPSKKFRQIHPKTIALLHNKNEMQIRLYKYGFTASIFGYLDFLLHVFPTKFSKFDNRKKSLEKLLRNHRFDYLHCLEIQGAGYLLSETITEQEQLRSKIILTNWGSDIFYFKDNKDDYLRIQKSLSIATHYSAECIRDYQLARELGYKGIELPCIPNAGGFNLDNIKSNSRTSSRKNIVVKTYGGKFGRGLYAIQSVATILEEYLDFSVFFYSVTDDLLVNVKELEHKYRERVKFSTLARPISAELLKSIFNDSRIYIGCSISDGISTSFLESLISGTYPIQTDTSCANEWVNKGAVASIIPLDADILLRELRVAIQDNSLVDEAQITNNKLAIENLEAKKIKSNALKFYSL